MEEFFLFRCHVWRQFEYLEWIEFPCWTLSMDGEREVFYQFSASRATRKWWIFKYSLIYYRCWLDLHISPSYASESDKGKGIEEIFSFGEGSKRRREWLKLRFFFSLHVCSFSGSFCIPASSSLFSNNLQNMKTSLVLADDDDFSMQTFFFRISFFIK